MRCQLPKYIPNQQPHSPPTITSTPTPSSITDILLDNHYAHFFFFPFLIVLCIPTFYSFHPSILHFSLSPPFHSLSHHSVPSVPRYSFRRPHLRLPPAVQPRPPPQTHLPPSLPSLPPPLHRHPRRPSPSLLLAPSPPLFLTSTEVPPVPCPPQTRPPSRPPRVHLSLRKEYCN